MSVGATRLLRASFALCASVLALVGATACGSSGTSRSSSASSSQPGSSTTSSGTTSTGTTSTGTTSTGTTSTESTSSTNSPTATTSAAGASSCRSSDLRLSFVSGQGAAGTAYLLFQLTNAGARTCTMIGYPGVAALDAQGGIVQHPARRGIPMPAPVKLLSLNPGQRARFTVTSSDVIPSPGCQHAYSGTTVQVYPPNQRAALLLSHPMQFCNLHVGAVQLVG